MTTKEIVDKWHIATLVNTDESPFWYLNPGLGVADARYRYHHETGRVGDHFYDGNNGDRWRVLAINLDGRRAIVRNISQKYTAIVTWREKA